VRLWKQALHLNIDLREFGLSWGALLVLQNSLGIVETHPQ
jgi:hypothetical protein